MHCTVCKFPIVLGRSNPEAKAVEIEVDDHEPVYRTMQKLSEALCDQQRLTSGVSDIGDDVRLGSDGKFRSSEGDEVAVGLPVLERGCFIDMVDTFFLDLDGVIWKGKTPCPGVDVCIEKMLIDWNKSLYFVTNNATRTRSKVLDQLRESGIFDRAIARLKSAHGENWEKEFGKIMSKDKVQTSSWTAALYLKRLGYAKNGKKVFAIGEAGLREELESAGIVVIGADVPFDDAIDDETGEIRVDPDIGAVVVGLDKNLHYKKIHYAFVCLTTLPTQFLATNIDASGHFSSGQIWPGAAACVYSLVGTTKRHPILVGKPTGVMAACATSGVVDPARVCMIGDRMDTDILFGHKCGFYTCLVMTGVTDEQMLFEGKKNFETDATHLYDLYQTAPPYRMPVPSVSQGTFDSIHQTYGAHSSSPTGHVVPHFLIDAFASLAP